MPRHTTSAALALVLPLAIALAPVATAPAAGAAEPFDRVVKRDAAGDVGGDRTRPVDIRRIVGEHYTTGGTERLVLSAQFGRRLTAGRTELSWYVSSTGPETRIDWKIGGRVTVTRDGRRVSATGVRRSTEGRTARLTVPWSKLGNPQTVQSISLGASYSPDGFDSARADQDLD